MSGFFQTLLRPDREEDPERTEVARAANLLQIGEFQLLQLAYHEWFGDDMTEAQSDHIFRAYMLRNEVPAWARHFARQILARDAAGMLDDSDPAFHRYDCEYYRSLPLGARRLAVAIACIAFVVWGGILVGHFSARSVTSVLPPYFEENELGPRQDQQAVGDLRGS
ncbi:MAG: hypothetical protein D6826_05060 [Alphaproteobacteria bacterium]|nr:MAG: hypothetical protein D6826_05060 [Alphaproteobacteria bacterium]